MFHSSEIKVHILPSVLIDALTANKAKHQEDYAKAVVVYFQDLAQKTTDLYNAAVACDLSVNYVLNLPKPVNNTENYDKYIGMFTMCTDQTIELSVEDFNCFVNDKWDWAISASLSNSVYSSKYLG